MFDVFLEGRQQARVTVWVLVHGPPCGPQRAFGRIEVVGFPEEEAKALQRKSRDAVA